MSLKKLSEDSTRDLNPDLPTSPGDVAALQRAREIGTLSFAEALAWLSQVNLPVDSKAERRRTAKGWEPFTLD